MKWRPELWERGSEQRLGRRRWAAGLGRDGKAGPGPQGRAGGWWRAAPDSDGGLWRGTSKRRAYIYLFIEKNQSGFCVERWWSRLRWWPWGRVVEVAGLARSHFLPELSRDPCLPLSPRSLDLPGRLWRCPETVNARGWVGQAWICRFGCLFLLL